VVAGALSLRLEICEPCFVGHGVLGSTDRFGSSEGDHGADADVVQRPGPAGDDLGSGRFVAGPDAEQQHRPACGSGAGVEAIGATDDEIR